MHVAVGSRKGRPKLPLDSTPSRPNLIGPGREPTLIWSHQLPLLRIWKWCTDQLSQMSAELRQAAWKPYARLGTCSCHAEAEGSQSVEKGGNRPRLQTGGCLGLGWFPDSGSICEARLHFISEIFLISQRCKLAAH